MMMSVASLAFGLTPASAARIDGLFQIGNGTFVQKTTARSIVIIIVAGIIILTQAALVHGRGRLVPIAQKLEEFIAIFFCWVRHGQIKNTLSQSMNERGSCGL